MYSRLVRPAGALVTICGVASCAIVLFDGEQQTTTFDPDALRYTMAGVLGVFGVLAPGLAVLWGAALWRSVTGMFLALTGNAVALGGKVAAFPQTAPMMLAIAVSLLSCTAGLLAVADAQARKPPRSRF